MSEPALPLQWPQQNDPTLYSVTPVRNLRAPGPLTLLPSPISLATKFWEFFLLKTSVCVYIHFPLLSLGSGHFFTQTTDCHSLFSDLSASSHKCKFDSSQLPKILLNLYMAYKAVLHLAPAHPSRLAPCHSAPPATPSCSEISEIHHYSPHTMPLAYNTLPLPSPLRSFLLHPANCFLYFKTQLKYLPP